MAIVFTEDELKTMKIVNKLYKEKPITSKNPLDESNLERFSLSAHWTDIVCGNYNSDVAANFAGKKGSGKSYSCIEIGRMCAIRISAKLNNDDGKAWKDYFSVEENCAIMDVDKLIEILTRTEHDHHQVIIGDDVGTILGARQYRSESNQALNNCFVVNRTANNIFMSSAPETKHVDRQARDLPEHQLDFERNDALMSIGLAQCKYFKKLTNPKDSESYFKYPYWRNAKVQKILIPKPPKEMCDAYDHFREIGKRKIQDKLKEALSTNEETESQPKKAGRLEKVQENITEAQNLMDSMRDTDFSNQKKFNIISSKLGVSPYTVKGWHTNGRIC